jgi:hypothetical protein
VGDFSGAIKRARRFQPWFLDHPERRRSICAACIDQIGGWSIRHALRPNGHVVCPAMAPGCCKHTGAIVAWYFWMHRAHG